VPAREPHESLSMGQAAAVCVIVAPADESPHTDSPLTETQTMACRWLLVWGLMLACAAASRADDKPAYDVVIRGGTVYDGSGKPGVLTDVAIAGDRIAAIGDLTSAKSNRQIDARGMAVAPGFVNMLSWATVSLLADGRSQSNIRQGVTLEIFGEGMSMGPLNPRMRKDMLERQGDISHDVPWTTLGEYLEHLVQRGVSCNVASFLGATTVRIHVLGYEDRRATPKELDEMRALVRQAMQEGALGIGSSLIYAPAFYADTNELIEMCKVAAEYQGIYISHMRSEGSQLVEAVEELIKIAREAGLPAEIYHLKAAGKENWSKRDKVIELVEKARAGGTRITADMYTYTAGSTGLNGAMPPWVQEGGLQRWIERLRDPDIRKRVAEEMRTPTDKWENLLEAAGSPQNVLLVGFKNRALKHLTGKTLAEVSARRSTSPEETAMDLVIEDNSRVDTVYFMMNEEDVKKNIALSWVSFGSDAASVAPEGPFLLSQPHPRTYGNFARLLGKYVREEKVITLEEAIRKLSGQPAENLGLRERGLLREGYLADVVVFDPQKIADHATYAQPHQYATGMQHVFVNGTAVLADGQHTGAKPGRVVWGRGRTK
jgi:N-acyl-D-amino-acid deacylase